MYIPNSKWTWAFFLVALIQAIICLGFETYVFGKFQVEVDDADDHGHVINDTGRKTIPTYLSVFIFGFLYELVLVWDALRLKNTIQVIGVCLYNLGMLIYSAVEVNQVREAVKQLANSLPQGASLTFGSKPFDQFQPFLVAAPCVIALGTVLLSFVAWKLYNEFAWTIYKHISADLRMKRRYLTYQIYVALLKFDFFFFLGFAVQFLVIVAFKQLPPAEFGLTIAAVPIVIVLLFVAAWITRKEFLLGQLGIICLYFAALTYFIYKLVRMWYGDQVQFYAPVRSSLTTFAVLTLIAIILTIAAAIVCTLNFGKGLKPYLQDKKGVIEPEDVKYADPYHGQAHQLGQVHERMTID